MRLSETGPRSERWVLSATPISVSCLISHTIVTGPSLLTFCFMSFLLEDSLQKN